MRLFLILLLALGAVRSVGAGERVILYAELTEGQLVELTDGSKWQMDKGDCFPVVAYKESHTKLILQLAGAQFMVPASKTRIVSEKQLGDAMAKYRTNVNTYISTYASRWKNEAGKSEPGKSEPEKK